MLATTTTRWCLTAAPVRACSLGSKLAPEPTRQMHVNMSMAVFGAHSAVVPGMQRRMPGVRSLQPFTPTCYSPTRLPSRASLAPVFGATFMPVSASMARFSSASDHSDVPSAVKRLLDNNSSWVQANTDTDPQYFERMAAGQSPEYLWIGCSDSRVPAENVTGSSPGDMFVHRNIANMVVATDISCLSVIQFAVDVLKVRHIIVCGHYNCGGVKASMDQKDLGLIENWLRNIRDVARLHDKELQAIADEDQRYRRLVELNVAEQCVNVLKNGTVQARRVATSADGTPYPQVHGLVHELASGKLRTVPVDVASLWKDMKHTYRLT